MAQSDNQEKAPSCFLDQRTVPNYPWAPPLKKYVFLNPKFENFKLWHVLHSDPKPHKGLYSGTQVDPRFWMRERERKRAHVLKVETKKTVLRSRRFETGRWCEAVRATCRSKKDPCGHVLNGRDSRDSRDGTNGTEENRPHVLLTNGRFQAAIGRNQTAVRCWSVKRKKTEKRKKKKA